MRLMFSVLTLAACLLMAYPAAGQSCRGGSNGCGVGSVDSCGHCGVRAHCQKKTVRVVCDLKKVKQICWAVECETFRPPIPVGYGKKSNCEPCRDLRGGCGDASCGSRGVRTHGLAVACAPGRRRVKKKLMMREIEVEIPVYKAEVRYLCPTCRSGCDSGCGDAPNEASAAGMPALAPDQQTVRVIPFPAF